MGMGTGSYFGKNIFGNNLISRVKYVTIAITLSGIIIFILYPFILNQLLVYSQLFRSIVTFFMILPFGFLLGIPFPSAVLLLKEADMENYIPWMYGINGIMSVFGSVSAVILSMLLGFTPAFFAGLSFYLLIYLIMVIFFKSRPKTV